MSLQLLGIEVISKAVKCRDVEKGVASFPKLGCCSGAKSTGSDCCSPLTKGNCLIMANSTRRDKADSVLEPASFRNYWLEAKEEQKICACNSLNWLVKGGTFMEKSALGVYENTKTQI